MFVLAVLLAGCSDQNFNKAAAHVDVGVGDILVEPAELDFGALGSGEVGTAMFTVSNIGPEESILTVSGVTIGGASGGFTILTAETELTLVGGTSTDIEVAYSPQGANAQTATSIVASDDEDEKKVTVNLLGQGLVPELQVNPSPVVFGAEYVGCSKTMDVKLTNVGTDQLVVGDLAMSGGAEFSLTNPNVLPLTLDPGVGADVQITFYADDEKSFSGALVAQSNEPIGSRTTDVSGSGEYGTEKTDTWDVPTDPPADIVFFVDQSGSMDDDQQSLATNFSGFISQLNNYTTDWHIEVINDDDGCNNSGLLMSTTPGYEAKFEAAVTKGGGNWTESGLHVTSVGVDNSDLGECNEKLLRPDALLHIIMVSDEPEQGPKSWSEEVNRVIGKKGDASLVKFSAIAGDYPSGCSSKGNSADYGSGYYEAVNATGGLFLSICSNWATSVKALADASVVVNTFDLSRTPDPTTIVVKVNGKTAKSGWTYDGSANSIVFDGASTPAEGASVEATYNTVPGCN